MTNNLALVWDMSCSSVKVAGSEFDPFDVPEIRCAKCEEFFLADKNDLICNECCVFERDYWDANEGTYNHD